MNTTTTKSQSDEDDKAKLAYALAGKTPYADAMIREMFGLPDDASAARLIAKGKRLAAQTIGRKA